MDNSKPYAEYKASGVDWLGDIPKGWEVKRLKFVASCLNSNVDKKSHENEQEVLLCNYVDVYKNEIITHDLDLMKATASSAEIAKFSLNNECVVITKDSESWTDIAVPAFVPSNLQNVVCGYHLAIIKSEKILAKYIYYMFKSPLVNQQYQIASNGVTRFGLPQSGITCSSFLMPPLPEQQAIANFLDQKCARIDSLIKKKQKFLELLEEKRRTLITHAVTRGLDASAPLKASGVDWLDDIPKGWEVKRVRFSASFNPSCSKLELHEACLVSFVPMEAVGELGGICPQEKNIEDIGTGYTFFEDNDILIAKITPCFENGKGALALSLTNGIGFGSTEFHVVRTNKALLAEYFFYVSISHVFRKAGEAHMYGAGGQKRIPESFVKNYPLPIPPLPEQQVIVDYLNTETAAIDKQKKHVQASIELLKEYRASLITHAVTGKIDVRDMVTQ